jgi:WD40 repeat protein
VWDAAFSSCNGASEGAVLAATEAGLFDVPMGGGETRRVGDATGVTAVAAHGTRLAYGTRDGVVVLIDRDEVRGSTKRLSGHTDAVASCAFSPNGQLLATASRDGTIRLWEVDSGSSIPPLRGHDGWILSVAFSPDGEHLVSGSADGTAKVWDLAGNCLFTLRGHSGMVHCVKFTLDGTSIATGGSDWTVRFWPAHLAALRTIATSRISR